MAVAILLCHAVAADLAAGARPPTAPERLPQLWGVEAHPALLETVGRQTRAALRGAGVALVAPAGGWCTRSG